MRRADRLVTNSHYSRREIEANVGIPAARVRVIHHGVPDPYGELPAGQRRRMALNVGFVTRANLEIKGQRAFVEAARELPDVEFVLAGLWKDDAIERLRALASPNVRFTGWLERPELDRLFRQAATYVQPSHHEGFGLAVAGGKGFPAVLEKIRAKLPVAFRMIEALGLTAARGMIDRMKTSDSVAERMDLAQLILKAGPEAGARARERILREFPVEMRRRGLYEAIEELWSSTQAS